jgi:D-alanyl-D-alanine carboxypeptidase (penicillin-binding protein 5/6)
MKDFQKLLTTLQTKSKDFFNTHHHYFFYASLSLIPIILFLITYLETVAIKRLTILPDPFPVAKAAEYPLFERTFSPQISAQAAYILEADSKVVLFAKNDSVRFSPASTTKIITALTALDYFKLDDVLTIQRANVEPVVVGFPKGAKVTFQNILYGLLVPSGNDCAYAIADNYPGGMTEFVAAMNKKAKLLHLDNTHFGDPVGLEDDEDYSTVRDMAIMASYGKSHPILSKIVATKAKDITDSTGQVYHLKTTNKLLGLYGVNGVKTGFTSGAGEVLATSADIHNHTFILIVMKSEDRFADTEKLLQLLTDNVTFVPIRP